MSEEQRFSMQDEDRELRITAWRDDTGWDWVWEVVRPHDPTD